MKKTYILRIIILITIIFSLHGCIKDPGIRTTEYYSMWFQNIQGQRAFAGEDLEVQFWFSVVINENYKVDSVKLEFEVAEGGGSVSTTGIYITPEGAAETTWTLGNESFSQLLRASVYDLSGRLIGSDELVAFGFRENQADRVTGSAEVSVMDMAADTINGVTFMTTYSKLYRQGDRYYIWEEVTHPLFLSPDAPRTVEIDCNGVVYVSTSGGNIIRSLDHGSSWQPCTKPWPDRFHYLQIYLSNDNRLWVVTQGELIRYSDNSGVTWHDAGAGMSEYRVGDIFRLSDGTLMKHGLDCCSLAKSNDDGQTWVPLHVPGYSQKLYVNDNDEIFVLSSQGTGETIFRSDDQGATFTAVHSVGVSFRSSYDNIFTRWDDYYYVAVPGYGIMKSNNLSEFENWWVFSDFRTMYIDHNGVILVRDLESRSVYYLNYPD